MMMLRVPCNLQDLPEWRLCRRRRRPWRTPCWAPSPGTMATSSAPAGTMSKAHQTSKAHMKTWHIDLQQVHDWTLNLVKSAAADCDSKIKRWQGARTPHACFSDGRPWCRYAATNSARLRRWFGETPDTAVPAPLLPLLLSRSHSSHSTCFESKQRADCAGYWPKSNADWHLRNTISAAALFCIIYFINLPGAVHARAVVVVVRRGRLEAGVAVGARVRAAAAGLLVRRRASAPVGVCPAALRDLRAAYAKDTSLRCRHQLQ